MIEGKTASLVFRAEMTRNYWTGNMLVRWTFTHIKRQMRYALNPRLSRLYDFGIDGVKKKSSRQPSLLLKLSAHHLNAQINQSLTDLLCLFMVSKLWLDNHCWRGGVQRTVNCLNCGTFSFFCCLPYFFSILNPPLCDHNLCLSVSLLYPSPAPLTFNRSLYMLNGSSVCLQDKTAHFKFYI